MNGPSLGADALRRSAKSATRIWRASCANNPGLTKAVLTEIRSQGLLNFARDQNTALLLRVAAGQPEISVDPAKLQEAQRLFAAFGTEISGALLLAALPQSYATEFGAGVLGANAELERNLDGA